MADQGNVVHSRVLPANASGKLMEFTRQGVGWEWMSFCVQRIAADEKLEVFHANEETVCVLLSGICTVRFGKNEEVIGRRTSVFDGPPYALYLTPGDRATFTARDVCEIAVCHVPSSSQLPSRLVYPKDVFSVLRGGGNASRQVVDIIRPDFPAERLMAIEVYTPGGNWSSYPPHKHEVHNPPGEVDLDEIYYYRMNRPGAFAQQRLYASNGKQEEIITARDGDAVLVRDGYHPVVAGPGYDVYYLNFLAGSARSLAVTEDPEHAWIRASWNAVDERLPLIKPYET